MPENDATRLAELENALRHSLSEHGIDSLDALVQRVASSQLKRLRQQDAGPLWRTRRDSQPPTPKPHKAPEVDLFIDGERYQRSKIVDFSGRHLYSTAEFDTKGEPVAMHSFTSMEGLHDYLVVSARHDLGTTNPDSLSEVANYFVDPDQRGDRLQNDPSYAWPDLTEVPRSAFGLGDWNDVISSVDWCRWDITLYEHINYNEHGGSLFLCRAGRTHNHLGLFGWDDRASSTWNNGFRV